MTELAPYCWHFYTKKIKDRIKTPFNAGKFTQEKVNAMQMHLTQGSSGSLLDGNQVEIYLLVDPSDGCIADAKFQAFGSSILIAISDFLCDLLLRKNLFQAGRISADLLEKEMFSQKKLPSNLASYLNLCIFALDDALTNCKDLALDHSKVSTPIAPAQSQQSGKVTDFFKLSDSEKLKVLQEVIDTEIQPYVALDDGGVEVKEIKNNNEVIIVYQGSCTSCYSAIGSTLSAIEGILKEKVDSSLIVTPDSSVLNF